jgi:MFS family permease
MLATASVAQGAMAVINSGLPAIGPQLQHAFGLGLPLLGIALDGTLLGMGLALPATGYAVEHWGAARVSAGGACVASLGFVLAVGGRSPVTLVAGLVLAGVGASVIPMSGVIAVMRAYPRDRRGWAFGVRQMCVPLGGMTAAVLLPGLTAVSGVRLALAVGGALTVIACLVSGVVYGDLRSPRQPAAAHNLAALRRVERLPRLLVVTTTYVVALEAVFLYSVPAVRAAGLSELGAAVTFFLVTATGAAARVAWGRRADRQGGGRRADTLSHIGLVTGIGALLFVLARHSDSGAMVACAMLMAFGALGWNGVVFAMAGELAPPMLAVRSVGLTTSVVFLLGALSAPLLGLVAAWGGWDALWLVAASSAFCGAAISRSLSEPDPA